MDGEEVSRATDPFEIRRLDPIGVEIVGLDLAGPVDEGAFRSLRETIVREGLVLLREQWLDAATQIALGRRFGPLENTSLDLGELDESKIQLSNVDGAGRLRGQNELEMRLVAINEGWHSDGSFRDVPASFSLFLAETVPEEGGDTFYLSLERAWQALSPDERQLLYGLRAVHDYERAYAVRGIDLGDFFGDSPPVASHPLVLRHPESGRTGLFVSEHVFEIEGMAEAEARPLLDRLMAVSYTHLRAHETRSVISSAVL